MREKGEISYGTMFLVGCPYVTHVGHVFLGKKLRKAINFLGRPLGRGGKKTNFDRGDFRNSIKKYQKNKFDTFLAVNPKP